MILGTMHPDYVISLANLAGFYNELGSYQEAIRLGTKAAEIKKELWGGHLWNPSYFVATVSDRTLEQVKTYIDNQKKK